MLTNLDMKKWTWHNVTLSSKLGLSYVYFNGYKDDIPQIDVIGNTKCYQFIEYIG